VLTSRPSASLTRASLFGMVLHTSEPATFNLTAGCNNPTIVEQVGAGSVHFVYTMLSGGPCAAGWGGALDDFATPINRVTGLTLSPAYVIGPLWQGPYASTARYDDPRPIVASAGMLPFETQAASSPPMVPPLPYELVARDTTNLVTFGINLLSPPAPCSPECPIIGTSSPLAGLDAVTAPPQGARAAYAGAELFVAMQRGPLSTLYARRSVAGAWSALQVAGELHNDATTVRRLSVVDGGVVSALFDPNNSTFDPGEYVSGTDGGAVELASGWTTNKRRTSLISVSRDSGVEFFYRNAGAANWVLLGGRAALPGVTFLRPVEENGFLNFTMSSVATSSTAFGLYSLVGGFQALNALGPATGFDVVDRADVHFIVVAQAGDVRLYLAPGGGFFELPGPPRAVPLAPGDNRLDIVPGCEAAWPRLALIEDALIVTWQERCSPETTWRVAMRIIQ
jgi:hypothetical protein